MRAKLYGIPGSHPVRAAQLMLDHKGIPWEQVDVPNVLCRPFLRARGFPGPTVPAMVLDGRKVQTTRTISRTLDEVRPDPPLFPADPDRRRAVEEAERWGDEVLQPVPRRIAAATLVRDRAGIATFLERPLLGMPPKMVAATAGPIMAVSRRINSADDDTVRADIAGLPGLLDRVDELLATGTLGGEQPNAADFQIAVSEAAADVRGRCGRGRGPPRSRACAPLRAALSGPLAQDIAWRLAGSPEGLTRPG